MRLRYLLFRAAVMIFSWAPSNMQGQNFYGSEFTVNYNPSTSNYDVVLGLYQDSNLDTSVLEEIIHPGIGDPEATITTGLDTVIEISAAISLYRYSITVNYGNNPSVTAPFWGNPTPLPLGSEIDNITDNCTVFLRAPLQLSGFGEPETNPTIAHWVPYPFDHYIDEAGVFHMQLQGVDDPFGKVSYHGAVSLYGDGSTCLEEGAFDSLQINQSTGEILWPNLQPGTFLFGFELVEWYGDYLVPLSRFPRFLIITIDEDDIVSAEIESNQEVSSITIFPNPATNKLWINVEGLSSYGELRIINATGQKHYSIKLEDNFDANVEIDVASWQSGLYLVQVRQGQRNWTRKLVVK